MYSSSECLKISLKLLALTLGQLVVKFASSNLYVHSTALLAENKSASRSLIT